MRFLLVVIILFFSVRTIAQSDPHFSMVHNAPLYLNPANIGTMDGTYRVGLNYRNQWNSVAIPFETSTAYADFKTSPKFLNGRNLGWGIQVMNDRLGNGGLNKNMINAGVSVPYYITENRSHVLYTGAYLGFYQMNIDASKLNFESSFNYVTTQFSGAGNPQAQNLSSGVMDMGVGCSYQYHDISGYQIHGGIALAHPGGRALSLTDESTLLYTKTSVYSKAIYQWENILEFRPTILYMNQGNANTAIFGTEVIYGLGRRVIEKIDLRAGVYHRWADAAIFTFGMNHENFSVNFSYDITTSSLSPASMGRGAFEFSISYVNRMFKGHKDLRYILPGNRLL